MGWLLAGLEAGGAGSPGPQCEAEAELGCGRRRGLRLEAGGTAQPEEKGTWPELSWEEWEGGAVGAQTRSPARLLQGTLGTFAGRTGTGQLEAPPQQP